MEENPFLNEEEEYVTRKPTKEYELTEAQKKRNFKGLELVKEAIRKAIPYHKRRGDN